MKNFKMQFSDGTEIFSKITLSIPYDKKNIIDALTNETNWIQDPSSVHRSRLYKSDNKILNNILNYFSSEELNELICDHCYDYFPELKLRWDIDLAKLKNITCVHGEFNKDLPGWRQEIHQDVKHYICTGFIYFTDHDNEELSSFFYSNKNGDNPIRATTDFGTGWIHFNDINSWHGGQNITKNEVRYTLLFPLLIKNLRRNF